MSKENWDDKNFVLEQVQNNSYSLKYASDRLKDDKAIVLAAVSNNGWAIEYASKRLREDKEIVLAAVSDTGLLLGFFEQNKVIGNFNADKDIVLAAAKSDSHSFEYASKELRSDISFCIEVAKKCDKIVINCFLGEAEEVFSANNNKVTDVLNYLSNLEKNKVLLEKLKENQNKINLTTVFKMRLSI
jgi:hypothetical protein